MMKKRKILLILFIILISGISTAAVIMAKNIKNIIISQTEKNTGRKIFIDNISINIFNQNLYIKKVQFKEKDGEKDFVCLGELKVRINLKKLIHKEIQIDEIKVNDLEINIAREKGLFNFEDIKEKFSDIKQTEQKVKKESNSKMKLTINNMKISNAKIRYKDDETGYDFESPDLNLDIPNFSESILNTELKLSLNFKDGNTINILSLLKLNEKKAEIKINTESFDFVNIEKNLENLNKEFKISGKIDVNLLLNIDYKEKFDIEGMGNIKLNKFNVAQNGKKVFYTETGEINLTKINPMIKEFFVDKIALYDPEINISGIEKSNNNKKAEKKAENNKSEKIKYKIENIVLNKGKILYNYKEDKNIEIYDIKGIIKNISYENEISEIKASFKYEDKSSIYFDAKADIHNMNIESKINVENLDMQKITDTAKEYLDIGNIEGTFSLNAEIKYNTSKIYFDGFAGVKDFLLKDKENKPMAAFSDLKILFENSDFMNKKINIKRVLLDSPKVLISKKESGNNFDILKKSNNEEKSNIENPGKKELYYKIEDINILNGIFIYNDEPKKFTYTLTDIGILIKNIASQGEKTEIKAEVKTEKKAAINIKGSMEIEKSAYDLKINIGSLILDDFGVFLKEKINIGEIRGIFDADIKVKLEGKENIKIESTQSNLRNLLLTDSKNDKIANIENLGIEKLKIDLLEKKFSTDKINFKNCDIYFKHYKENNTIKELFGKNKENKPVEEKKEESKKKKFEYDIGKFTMENGGFYYKDFRLSKEAKYEFEKIKIEAENISNLSKDCKFKLSSIINQKGLAVIEGRMRNENYLVLNTDVYIGKFPLKDIEAYIEEYIGYTLESGEATLKSNIKYNNNFVDLNNEIFVSNLYLGKEVKKDTGKLTIKLALEAIKDEKGNISLEVPVKGEFKEMKTNLNSVIFTAFRNIAVKTAMSISRLKNLFK